MRRARIGVGAVAFLVAGAIAPAVAAAQTPTAPAPVAPVPALAPGTISPGVTIAGVQVGGLPAASARTAVIAQYVVPRRTKLVVTFRGRNLAIDPVKAGYVANVDYAVQVAMLYGRSKPLPATGTVDVPVRAKVNAKKLRSIIASRAARYDLPARDAALSFKGVTPVVRKPRVGIAVDQGKAAKTLTSAILVRDRARYALPSKRVIPAVTNVG
ncbi:MAG: peptidoglycan binding domain-containing protein, partial [Thermoleophilia bacterium]